MANELGHNNVSPPASGDITLSATDNASPVVGSTFTAGSGQSITKIGCYGRFAGGGTGLLSIYLYTVSAGEPLNRVGLVGQLQMTGSDSRIELSSGLTNTSLTNGVTYALAACNEATSIFSLSADAQANGSSKDDLGVAAPATWNQGRPDYNFTLILYGDVSAGGGGNSVPVQQNHHLRH